MSLTVTKIKAKNRDAKLAYRGLVQDVVNEHEVTPDDVEHILLLAGRSYDDLERDTLLLEQAIADQAAYGAKNFDANIEKYKAMLTEAAAIRKEIEPLQKQVNEAVARARSLEQQGLHHNSLRNAANSERSELIARRKRLLGTTKLEEFPAVD